MIEKNSLGPLEIGVKATLVDLSDPFREDYRNSAHNIGKLLNLELGYAIFKSFVLDLTRKEYSLILKWWTSFGY